VEHVHATLIAYALLARRSPTKVERQIATVVAGDLRMPAAATKSRAMFQATTMMLRTKFQVMMQIMLHTRRCRHVM